MAISEVTLEQILIRKLPTGTKAALAARAKRHQRSVEAEARALIASGLANEDVNLADLLRDDTGSHIEFEPERLQLQGRRVEL